jgi:two-component system, cell cycle response regulator
MEYALIGTVREILDGPIFPADIDGRDELTGVHNTKSGVLRLDQEAKRALRFRHSLSCFILEIDGLWAVAETHGQRRAECVIQDTGTILRHCVRATDVVCRLDAERFLLITPRLDAPSAQAVGERIRRRVQRHRFPVPGSAALALTASVGVAAVAGPGSGAETLIQRAMDALEAARSGGGDRVALG